MADLLDHIKQAKHNQGFAEQLDRDQGLRHWDWLITIAFYSAIHYVEAFFVTTSIGHTEKACRNENQHSFRQQTVRTFLGHNCWKSYRKLQDASYYVRYLAHAISKQKPGIAVTYYSRRDASDMLKLELKNIREAVEAELAK